MRIENSFPLSYLKHFPAFLMLIAVLSQADTLGFLIIFPLLGCATAILSLVKRPVPAEIETRGPLETLKVSESYTLTNKQ